LSNRITVAASAQASSMRADTNRAAVTEIEEPAMASVEGLVVVTPEGETGVVGGDYSVQHHRVAAGNPLGGDLSYLVGR
jgi:hypothetical protein